MVFTHSEDRINFKELNIVLNYNEPSRNNPDLISSERKIMYYNNLNLCTMLGK